jgi:8-oxo-dGTP pyrophosphatase MutT (NUDIX family)
MTERGMPQTGKRSDAYQITTREVVWTCPWLRVVRKVVQPHGSTHSDDYYSIQQPDYVNIFALTREGLTPIVRQFRPAIETYSWELPAGLLDPGETPRAAAKRELTEETGLTVVDIVQIGKNYVDTGRLANRFHSFAAIAEARGTLPSEHGIQTRLVPLERLRSMILRGELSLQTHVGIVYGAMTRPASVRMLRRHGLAAVRRRFLA